jgi:hypothetical protein
VTSRTFILLLILLYICLLAQPFCFLLKTRWFTRKALACLSIKLKELFHVVAKKGSYGLFYVRGCVILEHACVLPSLHVKFILQVRICKSEVHKGIHYKLLKDVFEVNTTLDYKATSPFHVIFCFKHPRAAIFTNNMSLILYFLYFHSFSECCMH